MANHKAIAAVGRAIVNLLTDASRNEFTEAEFKLLQTADFANVERHPKEGASVCLYQVEVSSVLRDGALPGLAPGGEVSVSPISLKLKFLITPWASDPEKQYHLLGWIIQVLYDTPILPATLLNRIAPDEVIFSPDESAKLVFEPISLPDISILLQELQQPSVLPSVAYCASLVLGEAL
jgi:hypothetical protein